MAQHICNTCNESFTTQGYLDIHLDITHPKAVCRECDLHFDFDNELAEHNQHHHADLDTLSDDQKLQTLCVAIRNVNEAASNLKESRARLLEEATKAESAHEARMTELHRQHSEAQAAHEARERQAKAAHQARESQAQATHQAREIQAQDAHQARESQAQAAQKARLNRAQAAHEAHMREIRIQREHQSRLGEIQSESTIEGIKNGFSSVQDKISSIQARASADMKRLIAIKEGRSAAFKNLPS